MKMKRLFFIMACFCIASFSLVHAELLIIKRESGIDSPSRFVPLDKDDIAKHGEAISNVLLSYAWPMCISKLSFGQKTVADQEQKDLDELLAPNKQDAEELSTQKNLQTSPNKQCAEELFIQKKLQALPGLSNYHVIYIPTCLYELFSIIQIFSKPEKSNSLQIKVDELCAIAVDHPKKDAMLIDFSLEKNRHDNPDNNNNTRFDTASDVQTRMYKAYNTANDHFFRFHENESPALFINSTLTRMLFGKYAELESSPDALTLSNILQSKSENLASDLVTTLKNLHSESGESGLRMPHAVFNQGVIDDFIFSLRQDDEQKILAKIIALEYEAREYNKALLLRGTTYHEMQIGLGKNPEKKVLAGSTLYSGAYYDPTTGAKTPFSFEAFYRQKKNVPYSISFGNSLFAGALRDPTASAFNYLIGKRTYSASSFSYFKTVGYALFVNKKSYLDNKCGNLFFISPLAPLAAIMGRGELFHSRTTAAILKKDKNSTLVTGLDGDIIDPYGFLLITRDPLKHAELFSKFLAENGRFIQSGDEKDLIAEEKEFVVNVKKSQEEAADFYHTARRKLTPEIQAASKATLERAVRTFKNKKTGQQQTAQAAAQ